MEIVIALLLALALIVSQPAPPVSPAPPVPQVESESEPVLANPCEPPAKPREFAVKCM